jgi:hypothetical protein
LAKLVIGKWIVLQVASDKLRREHNCHHPVLLAF